VIGDSSGQGYTRGERIAGVAGLIVAGLLLLICLDMATGGALAAAVAPAAGCGGCGPDVAGEVPADDHRG